MSRKEKDLQKVISDLKDTIKDKELEKIKKSVASKVSSNGNLGNIADLLNDPSLQGTLQSLLQNKDILNLLNNPDLGNQLAGLLGQQNTEELMEQVNQLLKGQKKK